MRAVVLALALVALLITTGASPAGAHSDLVGSTPRDGARVSSGADLLVLVFGDDVLPGSVQVAVRDTDDVEVVAGPAAVTGATVEVPLEPLSPGPHEVTYRAVAGDGHTVVGGLSFDVTGVARGDGHGRAVSDPLDRGVVPVVAPPAPAGGVVPPVWWALGVAAGASVLVLRHRLRNPSTS